MYFSFTAPSGESLEDKQYRHFLAWQLVLGVLHWAAAFGLAGYAEAEGKDWTTQVQATYNAWASQNGTSCADGDSCVIYSVQEKIGGEVSLIWATASASIISGLHHFVAFFSGNWYRKLCVASGVNFVRWLDYAGSSAIMFAIVSILFTSPPDLYTLVLAFVLQFLVIVAGSGSEALWATGEDKAITHSKYVFAAAFFCYLAPWVVLYVIFGMSIEAKVTKDACGVDFIGNAEKQNPPDFVWAAVIGLVVTFTSFAGVHAYKINTLWKAESLEKVSLKYEYVYSFLSFTSKIILLANIAGGILGRSENNVTQAESLRNTATYNGTFNVDELVKLAGEQDEDDDDDGIARVWLYFITAISLAIVLGIALLWDAYVIELIWRRKKTGPDNVSVMNQKRVLMRAAGLVF